MFLLLRQNSTEILNKISIAENWKTLSETNISDELFKAPIFLFFISTFTEVMHIDYCINLSRGIFMSFYVGKCFLIELARALGLNLDAFILELFIFWKT